jgi:hypothetical protein
MGRGRATTGCSCALVPAGVEDGGGGGEGDTDALPTHHHPLSVRPGEARVFRLLQPCVRLSCAPACGPVSLADAAGLEEGDDAWVVGSISGSAASGWLAEAGGRPPSLLLRAVRLRADFAGVDQPAAAIGAQPTNKDRSRQLRALAAALFLGLNAAAAAVASSSA